MYDEKGDDMSSSADIHMKIDRKIKDGAEKLFSAMGLTLTKGIALYLYKVNNVGRIPFDLSVPDKKSLKLIAKARRGEGLHEAANVDELFKELHK